MKKANFCASLVALFYFDESKLPYPLPREKRFTSEETAFRISVEYMVQKKLIEKRIEQERPYQTVSFVTPGPFIGLAIIQAISDDIVKDFIEIYQRA